MKANIKLLQVCIHFLEAIIFPVFFAKERKFVTKQTIHRDTLKFRTLHFGDKGSDSLEKFICQLYGYKNESSVDKVRFKMFQTKDMQDLSLVPSYISNLKYTMRANYVANMCINAVRLNMCLEDPTHHGWREDGSAEWKERYFPANLDDIFSNTENLEIDDDGLESIDSEDFSKSSDSEFYVNSENIMWLNSGLFLKIFVIPHFSDN